MKPVRLEPAASLSRVKHSTAELPFQVVQSRFIKDTGVVCVHSVYRIFVYICK